MLQSNICAPNYHAKLIPNDSENRSVFSDFRMVGSYRNVTDEPNANDV